ncbi:TonB family protein [bacterium]
MIAFIQQFAAIWSDHVIWILVQNTIFLLFVIGILHLIKNSSANLKYWISTVALIKCLLPPFLTAPVQFLQKSIITAGGTEIHDIQIISSTAQQSTVFPFSFIESLFIGWFLLSVMILMIPLVNTLRLKYQLKNSKYIGSTDSPCPFPLYITDTILVPLTMGLIKPRIYVPKQWEKWSPDCQAMILRHEIAHIQRMDAWFQIIQMIVQAVYAFHPLIWILNRKMDEFREMACDDISVGPNRCMSVEYARALVRIAEDLNHAQLGYASASALIRQRNELLNRVQYQMEEPMKRISRWKTGLIMTVLILMIIPLSWTGAELAESSSPLTESETEQAGKIYGTITDTETGLPLVGANVVLEGSKIGAATDDQGNYFIPNLAPGSYNLQISMIGYGSILIKDVQVNPNSSAKAVFNLKPQVIEFSTIKAQVKKEKEMAPPEPPSPPPDEDIEFVKYDSPPEPIGGFEAVQKNLVYPENERKTGIEGMVNVFIQIDESGNVTSAKIEKSVNEACDQAAINALKSVKWKPAMQRDKPVAVWLAVPMEFKLSSDKAPEPPPPPAPNEEIEFVPYDTPPQPIGGFTAIQKNLVYPENERKVGIEGRVIVFIQIDESGNVIKAKIEQSVNEACDQAAINALKSVKWKPAMQRNRPLVVWIAVPMEFRLD